MCGYFLKFIRLKAKHRNLNLALELCVLRMQIKGTSTMDAVDQGVIQELRTQIEMGEQGCRWRG